MEPLKKQRSMPICVKRERNSLAIANQGFSTASQDSRHVHGKSWLCPPTLAQNLLSPKRIAPTDNVWSKLHDEYTH